MTSDPLIIGFDTSAAHCAAALLRGDDVLVSQAIDMTRGQAEELMPLLDKLLAGQSLSWQDIHVIGVGVGPGNFTGIRIAVSAARGLALALGVPAIGVSTFEASLLGQPEGTLATVPAPRGQHYVLDTLTQDGPLLSSDPLPENRRAVQPPAAAVLAENIARIASSKADKTQARPAPLYIRAADAAPARDLPPPIL
ncbi:tRNA (adenosine(37)-N6)-threonylcarbamoyltransferase complex dimerization subunit type 1 TsaB [Cognatishimia sp. SS12]|uniref:tRNA (adenosine(37)-N6)-threonylcarbamoyltransferase complex dimerization subunit type 1 TsaB n=1 Tax=Cognatishimia sp. SS12 TaxID=2979465 RepID=UPI00232E97B0|nr:tRNA (adenosine(37)-N6)-threonylcarbamoyltransferase complex dimerization subunit type 1 TsaB [Cognatishimia sp. SS12]MDC0739024.1 tRNA (adenosine(37)-N6)-threonylcarbamoyltransferase complex dimerization subunit type 1 TsaB [Cognatishimia sp. SS12]